MPEDTRALYALVQSYAEQKQTSAVVQTVRDYSTKHPKSAAVQQYLGQILAAGGDRVGARAAFEAAKAAKPELLDADFSLAELDATDGKLDDARRKLAEVASAHPDNKSAQLQLAQFQVATGKIPEAIEQYRKVVAIDGDDAMSFNALAYLLAESKQQNEAMKYAQQAWALAPNNPAVEDTMGWIYYQQGLYSLAVVRLEAATAKGGTAIREYHLALAYLKAGQAERGNQALQAALKLNPKLPEAQAARQAFGVELNSGKPSTSSAPNNSR